MKNIFLMLVIVLAFIGCVNQASSKARVQGNSHGTYFPTQEEKMPAQLHQSTSHGGEH
jgi:hypothetical protein